MLMLMDSELTHTSCPNHFFAQQEMGAIFSCYWVVENKRNESYKLQILGRKFCLLTCMGFS